MRAPTPAMRRAIELARTNGGRLRSYPSDDWAAGKEAWPLKGAVEWFTSATIQSLVDAGLAEYTKWQTRTRLPIEVTLTERAGER